MSSSGNASNLRAGAISTGTRVVEDRVGGVVGIADLAGVSGTVGGLSSYLSGRSRLSQPEKSASVAACLRLVRMPDSVKVNRSRVDARGDREFFALSEADRLAHLVGFDDAHREMLPHGARDFDFDGVRFADVADRQQVGLPGKIFGGRSRRKFHETVADW